MTMGPLYPCGKPSSTGAHNETEKKLTIFSASINRIMMESRPQISNHRPISRLMASNFEFRTNVISSSIESKILFIFASSIVFHKSRNPISTLGSSEFGPKYDQVFQSDVMSLC